MKKIQDVILFQLEQASKAFKQYSQRVMDKEGFGITTEQWVLLKIIEEANELSQKELAQKSTRDPASITRTLDILEKKGLIERLRIPGNRRTYNITLKKEGQELINQKLDTVIRMREKSLDGFSENEIKQLSGFLTRIKINAQ